MSTNPEPSVVANRALAAMLAAIQGLGLTWDESGGGNGLVVPVVARKMAQKEVSERQARIYLSHSEKGETSKPFVFGKRKTIYPIDIETLSQNLIDMVTGLELYLIWRAAIVGLFSKAPFDRPDVWGTVPEAFDVNTNPEIFLERAKIEGGLDYQRIMVEVVCVEET